MRIALLHTAEAAEPPADPVIAQVRDALCARGHAVATIAVDRTVEPLVAALRHGAPELVFNLAESFSGKSALESNVAALLNLLGLRYTGSSPAGLLLAGDKSLAKKVLRFHGIRTPSAVTVFRGMVDWADELRFPVIVKPPQEDASLGITSAAVVRDLRALFARIDALQDEYQQPVLVEQYVEGRELYVGVLGNAQARALPPMEMDFSGLPTGAPRIASWEAKWGSDGAGAGAAFAGTRSVFAEQLDPALDEAVRRVAVETFHALRLRDYARIDLRVTSDGDVYVLEANPNCYLERSAEFARAAERDGLPYEALVAHIVELAGARYAR